jgi:serine/threonine protein phosphatase PrpC
MKLRSGWLSIVGKRANNEDSCYVDPRYRFFLVADGMGGQSAGEKASGLAMDIVPRKLQLIDFEKATPEQATRIIDDAVTQANYDIMAMGEMDPKLKNMGTTITFVVQAAGTMYIGGVGDSRVYLLREGNLQQLTTDHSLTQALMDAGTLTPEEAVNHRYKNVLYRYLGCKEGGTGTTPKQLRPKVGDRFLICTDGVTGGANDATIAKILGAGADPQKTAEAIVQAASDGGSKDNITGVVIFVDEA